MRKQSSDNKRLTPEMRTQTSISPDFILSRSRNPQPNKLHQRPNNKSHFVHPFDCRRRARLSNTQERYIRRYKSVLEEAAADSEVIPEDLSVNNYLTSQISIAGITTRRFRSVAAERSLKKMATISTDFKGYPLSHRSKRDASESTSVQKKSLSKYLRDESSSLHKSRKVYGLSNERLSQMRRMMKRDQINDVQFYEGILEQIHVPNPVLLH